MIYLKNCWVGIKQQSMNHVLDQRLFCLVDIMYKFNYFFNECLCQIKISCLFSFLFNMSLFVFLLLNNSLTVINKYFFNFDINIFTVHSTVKSIFLFHIILWNIPPHCTTINKYTLYYMVLQRTLHTNKLNDMHKLVSITKMYK